MRSPGNIPRAERARNMTRDFRPFAAGVACREMNETTNPLLSGNGLENSPVLRWCSLDRERYRRARAILLGTEMR
jgi:hypothetical protein